MKLAPILIAGALAAMLVLATACGGDDEAPTARPNATSAPATTVPATAAPAATEAPTAAPAAPAGAELEISVNGDALTFTVDSLTASSGSEMVVSFKNVSGINQHNWVLVKDGTKDAVAADGTAAGPGSDWVKPGDDRVIANTKMLVAGEAGDVTFTAPAPGTYQFVCTFPGHNFTMFGDFEVTSG
ncbi:MAG: plastocyanin/azurin family copper-binding protein [Dehalococcoidia bacterium]|nr:plastocyanin/azurin family copper-binding protein [Dehalococcoidia bacterium]MDP7085779.1 plastocyanin/azurin family copper-binding protein [Dehalococcoidia bacterium]MDP7510506.1 plastocyanin/azurin family copper-binding protein [Dehalococcoidia bacterium]HJN88611.1 plastocyanin/azurin family copper-binding protein [Dehalococcoidia bacterium]